MTRVPTYFHNEEGANTNVPKPPDKMVQWFQRRSIKSAFCSGVNTDALLDVEISITPPPRGHEPRQHQTMSIVRLRKAFFF